MISYEYITFVFDYIGHMGPIITFSIASIFILVSKKYMLLLLFLLGSFFNLFVNDQLKSWIREPRPTHPKRFIDNKFTGAQVYGMPSGHAQICFYNIAFLWNIVSKTHVWVLVISICISILTLIQRWKFRRHTIEQLGAGSLVGSLIGYGIYSIPEIIRKF